MRSISIRRGAIPHPTQGSNQLSSYHPDPTLLKSSHPVIAFTAISTTTTPIYEHSMSSRQVPPYDSIPSQQKPRAILNHYFSGHVQGGNDGPQFMPFSQLPSELRLEVWKHFLRRHRLINIRVGSAKHSQRLEHPELESTYSITNTLGNTISAANYRLHVDPGHRRTSLFWVNHEARQAALKFYRIRIPCDIETCEEKRLLLYLNPEFDFLQIFPDIVPNNLVHFIYDLKAYDPLGVGVVNLGIHDLYSSSSLAEGMNTCAN